MSRYDDENAVAAVDDRMILMQKYVDLDHARNRVDQERKSLEEQSQKLAAELREVRGRLGTMLGFDNEPTASINRAAFGDERVR